jgi:hypothetical protein
MTIATFDPAAFKARYPQFVNVPDQTLTYCFQDAGLYLNNTDCSPVQDVIKRTSLLWMLTAHIAQLTGLLSSDGQSQAVGRVSSATEGSVSVSLDMGATTGTEAWFLQTQWGAAFWQATSYLRSMRYIPEPTRY